MYVKTAKSKIIIHIFVRCKVVEFDHLYLRLPVLQGKIEKENDRNTRETMVCHKSDV